MQTEETRLAVLPILEIPHPTLRLRARKVRKVGPSVLKLAHDMIDTMRDANGIGLAANQVDVLRRVIVIQLPEEDEARIYINPEIVHREGEREVEEGCLSIPGYRGIITRSVWVRFRALDHSSKIVKLKAEEVLAQALEHEVDHLNGILYPDHLKEHQELFPVEPSPEPDEGENQVQSSETGLCIPPDYAKASDQAEESDTDSLETPASLKVR